MARRPFFEGFQQSVVGGIRAFFARSPEHEAFALRQGGVPSVERAGLPYNLVSQFGYDTLAEHLRIDQDLQARYTDYEEMDEYPEIQTALDIYADDATIPNMDRGETIWVSSDADDVAKDLNDVLHKKLRIEDDVWGNCRTVAKYGNSFGELLVSDQGLVGLNYLPAPTVRRVEDPRGSLLGFVQDTRGEFNISLEDFYQLAKQRNAGGDLGRAPGELTVFEDWEIVHWRLRSKHLRSVYGHGVAEPARWIWKRLALLEDAMLIYKLSRAPSRYAFYVDVGEMDNQRGLAFVNRVKNQFAKKKFVNPTTGKLDMRYNPLAHDEDFFIPTRGGKDSTRIEVLQGPDYSETDTVEYHRDKLVSALKVPKNYMGYGGEASRSALSSEDIRFARTVMRIQREIRSGYRKACRVHLVAAGADADKYDYDVHMSVPSQILELAKLEVMSATADLAARMQETVSSRWILVHLFKFSEEDAAKLMAEKEEEALMKAESEGKAQAILARAQEEAGPGMGPEEQPPGGGGQEEPKQESLLREARAMRMAANSLNARLKRVEDWRREFERKPKSQWAAEDQVERILKRDDATFKRLREIGGMVNEIRGQLRG